LILGFSVLVTKYYGIVIFIGQRENNYRSIEIGQNSNIGASVNAL